MQRPFESSDCECREEWLYNRCMKRAEEKAGALTGNHTAPTPPSPVPTSSFTERDRGLANRQQRFKIAPCHDEDEVTKLLQRKKSVELT
uniref:Uncharacterized protein n=1 Tax=Vespula pensylvanica TaxID=30213 RepID=A0A834P2A8_VESPE|nr:hypothetical protein H0235_007996 [Vespula pensylvanica]